MKHIGNLSYAEGSRKKRKRIGRGAGSGHGGTSTRGHKGHQARTGFHQGRAFEGGQMPISRRLPKYGFKNPFRIEYQVVNVATLQELSEGGNFEKGFVNFDSLYELGLLRKRSVPVKILGDGELTVALHVTADKFSESAKKKIESAGGTVTINE